EDRAALLVVERAHADEDLAEGQPEGIAIALGRPLGLERDADLVEGGESVLEQEAAERGGVGVVGAGALEFQEPSNLAGGQDPAAAGQLAERRAAVLGLLFEEKVKLI